MRRTILLVAFLPASGAPLVGHSAPTAPEQHTGAQDRQVTEQDVIPILLLRCTVCHGIRRQEGDLDLHSLAGLLKGGKAGPAIVTGKPEESLVLKRILAGEMPPRRRLVEASIKVIEPTEIELLATWIAQGARASAAGVDAEGLSPNMGRKPEAEREFWSFQPPRRTAIPRVRAVDRLRTPVDAFVLDKLEQHGLSLAPEAERMTLIRRVYFDLLGLPPDPEAVQQFISDPDPFAYERLIDQLVSSPRYGERWARFWLDLTGYADSEGVQHADPIRLHAWRYRDYVIRALNSDKPYDRFLLEQIAGDELSDYENGQPITQEIYDNLVATGFLRMAPDGTTANITNFVPDRLEIIADELNILSSSVMGLTLKCARCHDHKLEPIPQEDYYRLAAVFKGAYDEHDWLKPTRDDQRGPFGIRLLPHVTSTERLAWERNEKQLDDEIASIQATVAARQRELALKQLGERLAKLPDVLHGDLREMLATPVEKRTEVQKYLAAKFEAMLMVDRAELRKLDSDFNKLAEEAEQKTKLLEGKRAPEPMIHALWDRGEPSPTFVLRRGNYLTSGRLIQPGSPTILKDPEHPFGTAPPWPGARKTGRRLTFARWLTRSDHPLTARVIVNRIWKHHFERGIVPTLDNFGKSGQPPSHPELLDWLATEFVQAGWSIKSMHRLIMTSSTYRQSSRVTSDCEQLDPDNKFLSRMPLRRLDAESLRDTLIKASGRLNETPFGPADPVETRPDGTVAATPRESGFRRTIYLLQRRTQIPTFLEDFDLPPMNPNCIERPVSTVAPQALHLLNNAWIHEMATACGHEITAHTGPDPSEQIERAYFIALGRPPTMAESRLATATLARMTEAWLTHVAPPSAARSPDAVPAPQEAATRALANICHALMNSAEFLHVD